MLHLRLTQPPNIPGIPSARNNAVSTFVADSNCGPTSARIHGRAVRACCARRGGFLVREKGDRPTKILRSRSVVHTYMARNALCGKVTVEGRKCDWKIQLSLSFFLPHLRGTIFRPFRTDPTQPSGIAKKFAAVWMHPESATIAETGMKNVAKSSAGCKGQERAENLKEATRYICHDTLSGKIGISSDSERCVLPMPRAALYTPIRSSSSAIGDLPHDRRGPRLDGEEITRRIRGDNNFDRAISRFRAVIISDSSACTYMLHCDMSHRRVIGPLTRRERTGRHEMFR